MNTINVNSNVHLATEGQALYASSNVNKTVTQQPVKSSLNTPDGAAVAQNIEQNLADLKADTQQLQKMSEMVNGNKLQFSFNKELNTVVVAVVDSNTNQVVKEIPSEDMQKLKLRIRQAIGSIFNEVI